MMGPEIFGWLGAFFFAICALPQALKSFYEKHSHGLSWGFLILWIGGEISTAIYVWPTGDIPLLINYLGNLLLIAVIVWYKVFPTVAIKCENYNA